MDQLENLQQLLQMGQEVQSRVAEARERLERETFTGRSGGGMVEVTVDGTGTVRGVAIDPAVVDESDAEMLEDLVLSAVSEAQRRARERLEEEMRDAAGGLGGLRALFGG